MQISRTFIMLKNDFFDRDACEVARALLGKIIRVKQQNQWLSAQIIETEAYYIHDKGSHASLGLTEKRKALFMPAGTIYMYYARGGDSFNVSVHGEGNAVLIKSAFPYFDDRSPPHTLQIMQSLNPQKNGDAVRPIERLCAGQTLLCRSLGLRVREWDQKTFDIQRFFIEDVGYVPEKVIQTVRLGIPHHRDPHLPFRFIDAAYRKVCTKNPRHHDGMDSDAS